MGTRPSPIKMKKKKIIIMADGASAIWRSAGPVCCRILAGATSTRPAMGCLRLINADYGQHSTEAHALTEREFDAGHVISAMLEDTGP
jgi:hypothetical protein